MGAWRMIKVPHPAFPTRTDEEPAYCPDAEPLCKHCEDQGIWIGPSNQIEDCPDCEGTTPYWNKERDGDYERY